MAQPSDFAVREYDRLPQPHPYGVARLFPRALYEAAHRYGPAPAAQRGPDLPVRVLGGRDPRALAEGDMDGACELANSFWMSLTANHFYLEVQDHGIEVQKKGKRGGCISSQKRLDIGLSPRTTRTI